MVTHGSRQRPPPREGLTVIIYACARSVRRKKCACALPACARPGRKKCACRTAGLRRLRRKSAEAELLGRQAVPLGDDSRVKGLEAVLADEAAPLLGPVDRCRLAAAVAGVALAQGRFLCLGTHLDTVLRRCRYSCLLGCLAVRAPDISYGFSQVYKRLQIEEYFF